MSNRFHAELVPPLVRNLQNLSHLLKRAESHAETAGFPVAVLLTSRLYPDMFDLTRQVQISTDISRRGVARLAGLEAPVVEDNETDVDQLQNRISDSIRFIEAVSPEALDGAEQALIRLPIPSSMGGGEREFTGDDFLRFFVLPNVYFHVSTTYAILRHNGVPIGKFDYLLGESAPTSQ
ncbi:MAG: hypothetical protein CMN96_03260 [Synechococcus sp. MED850]|jgi:hypothetical protein|nr:hypothetical protein [Synechococcus sp. MED850]OUW98582.1 MAG: hypothetical protein CBD89_01985 [Cyanobacteria bacterium TMED229]